MYRPCPNCGVEQQWGMRCINCGKRLPNIFKFQGRALSTLPSFNAVASLKLGQFSGLFEEVSEGFDIPSQGLAFMLPLA